MRWQHTADGIDGLFVAVHLDDHGRFDHHRRGHHDHGAGCGVFDDLGGDHHDDHPTTPGG
jgi:hypothetical protein